MSTFEAIKSENTRSLIQKIQNRLLSIPIQDWTVMTRIEDTIKTSTGFVRSIWTTMICKAIEKTGRSVSPPDLSSNSRTEK